MVKGTQKIRRRQPMSCLSVFELFVGLTLKGLTHFFPMLPFLMFSGESKGNIGKERVKFYIHIYKIVSISFKFSKCIKNNLFSTELKKIVTKCEKTDL